VVPLGVPPREQAAGRPQVRRLRWVHLEWQASQGLQEAVAERVLEPLTGLVLKASLVWVVEQERAG